MKLSRYNLLFRLPEGEYILYNTFAGSMAIVDQELKKAIQEFEEGANIPPEILKILKKLGAIIEDDVDERRILKCMREREKYDTEVSTFTILPTYACNFACSYCYQGAGEVLANSMANRTIHRVVRFVQNEVEKNRSRKVEIIFYGGEPLLRSKVCLSLLSILCPLIEDRGIEFQSRLVTNGSLFSPQLIKEFEKYGCNNVQITLHGPKETHDKVRISKDGKPTYDLLMDVLELLKYSKLSPSICINVDKENVSRIGDLLDDLKARGFQSLPIAFSPVLPVTNVCQDYAPLCLSEREMVLFRDLERLAKNKGFYVSPRSGERRSYLYCDIYRKSNYTIDPFGDVYKCWNFVGQKEHRIGVINELGEMEIEDSYWDIMSRDPSQIKECSNCKILPLCHGGCLSRAYFRFNSYYARGCYGEGLLIKDMITDLYRDISNKPIAEDLEGCSFKLS